MTFEDFMLGLAAEAPKLHHHAIRLLLHLVAVSLKEATYTITATDREICTAVGIGRGHIGAAKEALRGLVQIETRPRQGSTFRLPSEWFPLQMSLGSIASGTERVPRLAPTGGQDWHRTGATAGTNGGPSGTEQGPAWHQQGASVAPNGGQRGTEQGPRGTEQGPRLTGNQQDTGALSRSRIELGDSVVVRDFVFSIFSKRVLPPEQRPAATILAPRLQHVLHTAGQVEKAKILPDDGLLAQCLTIADVGKLFAALDLAKQRGGKPKGYGWFIPIFLEAVHGIPREVTSVLRDEYRSAHQRKQPGRAEPLPFPAQMTNQLVSGVKRLK